ncbi:hypothetical protein LPJ64_002023 [Coemansia asiatica]|uniref:Uncharacterized protein n=1 Tax=Coemansia asiatica TaxID=1052880 RepID=A0A9W7XKC0_9FUNG|nr:hypothetical protein LPJ64_002023 [Coemansia asiatica]
MQRSHVHNASSNKKLETSAIKTHKQRSDTEKACDPALIVLIWYLGCQVSVSTLSFRLLATTLVVGIAAAEVISKGSPSGPINLTLVRICSLIANSPSSAVSLTFSSMLCCTGSIRKYVHRWMHMATSSSGSDLQSTVHFCVLLTMSSSLVSCITVRQSSLHRVLLQDERQRWSVGDESCS